MTKHNSTHGVLGTDPSNAVQVDRGALQMALNVLRRAGKNEVADALASGVPGTPAPMDGEALFYLFQKHCKAHTGMSGWDWENVPDDFQAAWNGTAAEIPAAGVPAHSQSVTVETLRQHWLRVMECDHATGRDKPHCACSCVDLGWHPSVGAAVEAWLAHVSGVTASGDGSAWWALVMCAAASIEDAANCLRDPDAKKQAEGAAKHYREAAQKLMAASGVAVTDHQTFSQQTPMGESKPE